MGLRVDSLEDRREFFYCEGEGVCPAKIARENDISETRVKGFIPDRPHWDAGNNLAKDLSLFDSECIGCNCERGDGAFGDKKRRTFSDPLDNIDQCLGNAMGNFEAIFAIEISVRGKEDDILTRGHRGQDISNRALEVEGRVNDVRDTEFDCGEVRRVF